MKLEFSIRKKEPREEEITKMEIRYPNQNNRLTLKARWFYLSSYVFGVIRRYE